MLCAVLDSHLFYIAYRCPFVYNIVAGKLAR